MEVDLRGLGLEGLGCNWHACEVSGQSLRWEGREHEVRGSGVGCILEDMGTKSSRCGDVQLKVWRCTTQSMLIYN